jgi:hypothetical protein
LEEHKVSNLNDILKLSINAKFTRKMLFELMLGSENHLHVSQCLKALL